MQLRSNNIQFFVHQPVQIGILTSLVAIIDIFTLLPKTRKQDARNESQNRIYLQF